MSVLEALVSDVDMELNDPHENSVAYLAMVFSETLDRYGIDPCLKIREKPLVLVSIDDTLWPMPRRVADDLIASRIAGRSTLDVEFVGIENGSPTPGECMQALHDAMTALYGPH